MKQITEAIIRDLICNNTVELKCTHKKLCVPIINRIYKKMVAGIRFRNIKVHDRIICDGHHRYIASMLAGLPVEANPSLTTRGTQVVAWESVNLEHNDWDTPEMIGILNQQDAAFNNLPLEKIIEILK